MSGTKHTHGHYQGEHVHTAKSDQCFDAKRQSFLPSTLNTDTYATTKIKKKTEEKTTIENSGTEKKSLDLGRKSLDPKDELKLLKNWGMLKKTLIIGHIIDPLIERGIFTPDQWMALKNNQKSDQDTVEEFLYRILKCPAETYEMFLSALKLNGYVHVVNQLEGLPATDGCAMPSFSSGTDSAKAKQIGRPSGVEHRPRQPSVPGPPQSDPRNGVTRTVSDSGSTDSTVKQEDLIKMKDEITEELRQLRANILKDRDHDRLELKLLERQHAELQENFAQATEERETLRAEVKTFSDTVKTLQEQIAEKQNESQIVNKKNKELEDALQKKSGYLQEQLKQKEFEKEELVKAWNNKETEYKRLQDMLEKLKGEHEEKHTRLKGLNRDKVTLEKEVQLLNKEKRNLEVKIRSLEQHIRVLQETHGREIGDIKQQIEKQKTLLEEKEREKQDLERKLEERVRENENLKRTNTNLEGALQRTRDEKEHLHVKLKLNELSKHVVPPFQTGPKATRVGWTPKHVKK